MRERTLHSPLTVSESMRGRCRKGLCSRDGADGDGELREIALWPVTRRRRGQE